MQMRAQLIGDTYKKCKEFEVTSSKFATSIKDLIKISDDNHIQLHKIDKYHRRKDNQKERIGQRS